MAYAIVSDGCSSGARTDVGARIVAHSAEVATLEHWKRMKNATAENAAHEIDLHQQVLLTSSKVNLGLVQRDLLATSLYGYFSPQGGIVHVRGDGVIAFLHTDGLLELRRYEWNQNMPLYPAYFEDNFTAFANAHRLEEDRALTEETWTYRAARGFYCSARLARSVKAGIHGVTTNLERSMMNEVAFIAVLTDGVTQVEGIDWKDAVVSLMSFKSVAGSFAKRRMIRFIKDAQKNGKGPLDDIAYAVIRVEKEEEVHVTENR